MLALICELCGESFEAYPSARRRFCSNSCAGKVGPKTHGESRSRLHSIWSDMKSRCKGTAGKLARKYYFDRGIKVCGEWARDFRTFRQWALANGYAQNLELDRRENDKGYSPENCRWVTRKQQMYNTRKRKTGNETSRFKGVQRMQKLKKKPWRAMITKNGKPKHLGCFATEREAAEAYDHAARRQFGEFARLNLPIRKRGALS